MKKMFIAGKWVNGHSSQVTQIINPATGEEIDTVSCASEIDVDRAIQCAKLQSSDEGEWKNMDPGDRSKVLLRIAELIHEKSEEISRLETLNQGKTLVDSRFDVELGAEFFKSMAGMTGFISGQTFDYKKGLHVMTIREPLGVCGIIVPWNYPFYIMAEYTSQALAAGNTIVCKPSEITPLTAIALFEIFEEAGVPKGAANLLLGKSSVIGNAITHSHNIDKVVFIGSTKIGREVMKASAESNFKPLSLELGGKSPFIVFEDADMDTALDYAGLSIFMGAGQTCTAGSRMLLQDSIYDEFLERFLGYVKTIKLGSGLDEGTMMGPLVSEDHMKKVLEFIEEGKNEGARIVCGGRRACVTGYEKGFFVEPTVFTDVTNDMKIVQEEIFGPVLTVQKFYSEEDAIKLANSTVYGLAAGIFTNDNGRVLRMSRAVEAGKIYVNNYFTEINEAPCSALKQSGIGEEMGLLGLEGYTKIKQVNISTTLEPAHFFEIK